MLRVGDVEGGEIREKGDVEETEVGRQKKEEEEGQQRSSKRRRWWW